MNLWEKTGLEEKTGSRKGCPYVISVAGAGGKTSFLRQLAREGRERGKRVLISTTTHMAAPERYGVFDGQPDSVKAMLDKEKTAVVGTLLDNGKITCPGEEFLKEIAVLADLVLIEADGSKRLPMKIPAVTEPVIPLWSDEIYVVNGLSALERKPEEICHRWYLWEGRVPEEEGVTPELMAFLLKEKYIKPLRAAFPEKSVTVILNQADDEGKRRQAEEILSLMQENGLVLSLKKQVKRIGFVYMASGFGRRFGSNKLLAELNGKPLFLYGMEMMKAVKERLEKEAGWEISLAVSSQYDEILNEGEKQGFPGVKNTESEEGITASIRLGTGALGDQDAYIYFVADQPFMRAETVSGFLKQWREDCRTIGCVSSKGKRGNPAVFSGIYKEELLSLRGDKGGSQIMKRYPGEVMLYETDARETEDIDVKTDFI